MGNQIEEIQKLYVKTKTYTIPKEPKEGMEQISVEIIQLSLEDIGLLNMKENMPSQEIANNVRMMFAKSLGMNEPDVAKISFEFMQEILEAIMDANNLKDEDIKKTGIKKFIKEKQEQMQEKEKNEKSDRTT